MNTAENSAEIRDNLRGPWFEVARSPALGLRGAPTPFDEVVLKAVRPISSSLPWLPHAERLIAGNQSQFNKINLPQTREGFYSLT